MFFGSVSPVSHWLIVAPVQPILRANSRWLMSLASRTSLMRLANAVLMQKAYLAIRKDDLTHGAKRAYHLSHDQNRSYRASGNA
jgi:hypothetical protein